MWVALQLAYQKENSTPNRKPHLDTKPNYVTSSRCSHVLGSHFESHEPGLLEEKLFGLLYFPDLSREEAASDDKDLQVANNKATLEEEADIIGLFNNFHQRSDNNIPNTKISLMLNNRSFKFWQCNLL